MLKRTSLVIIVIIIVIVLIGPTLLCWRLLCDVAICAQCEWSNGQTWQTRIAIYEISMYHFASFTDSFISLKIKQIVVYDMCNMFHVGKYQWNLYEHRAKVQQLMEQTWRSNADVQTELLDIVCRAGSQESMEENTWKVRALCLSNVISLWMFNWIGFRPLVFTTKRSSPRKSEVQACILLWLKCRF